MCKILDYHKFLYELKQKDKESRKKATNISIKEMKYRPKIGDGDFDTKTRKVGEFLSEGHKVKVTIMFRGREVAHPELGKRILDRIAEIVGPTAKIEATPKLDGRNMVMVLAPEKKALPVTKPERGSGRPQEGDEEFSNSAAEQSADDAIAAAPNVTPEPTTVSADGAGH